MPSSSGSSSRGGLGLSPEADRSTLLRRVSFDLTGLPPEPDEVEAFLADRRPDAYEAMVDRLLASPRYGERWGRHWLDLAGYADSEGKREQDLPRPFAYRYRDYVIRALNADKPYDRFLLEQLAGDELARLRARAGDHAGDLRQPGRDRLPAHGPRLDLGEHHGLPPRPGRGGLRRDRRPGLGRDGAHAQVCPLPHAQVRPHPAPRLLPPGRGLQGGLRRVRLAQARDQHTPRAPQRRHARGPAPPARPARGAARRGRSRMRGCNARSTR